MARRPTALSLCSICPAIVALVLAMPVWSQLKRDQELPEAIRNYAAWETYPLRPVSSVLSNLCVTGIRQAQPPRAAADGSGPHQNHYLSLYFNASAAETLRSRSAMSFPEGSVIVKEKRIKPTDEAHGLGAMIKRSPGFDPAIGDWWFLYIDESGDIYSAEEETRACVECHAMAEATDYVFGKYVE